MMTLGLVVVACTTSAAVGAGPSRTQVSMESRVRADDSKIWLILSIRNDGERPVWINGRFSWSERSCKPPSWEITLNLLDARIRSLGSMCTDSRSPILDEDYRLLKRGEKYTTEIELGFCFQFEGGEKIRLSASYRDENEKPPKAPRGAEHVKRRVDAMPIEFVVPGNYVRP